MDFKLILFDLDGTLVDSAVDTTDALNAAIAPFNIPHFTVQEVKDAMGGGKTRLSHLDDGTIPLDWAVFAEQFAREYLERMTVHSSLYPGTAETLNNLSGRKKAVVSNKRESLTVEVLDRFGILPFFEIVVGGDSGAGRKPKPGPILQACTQLGVPAGQALMVGDCIYDVAAGRAAGVKTAAVTYGYGVDGFYRGADFVIHSLPELLSVLV